MGTVVRTQKIHPFVFAALACAGACMVSIAWGATYNFYFNNTEQGPNSTANPQLSISQTPDGKIEKKEGGQEMKVGETPAATTSESPATNQTTANAAAIEPKTRREFRRWSISPSYTWMKTDGREGETAGGSRLTLGARFNQDWSLGIFAGAYGYDHLDNDFRYRDDNYDRPNAEIYAGAELNFMPFRISFGRFEDLVSIGAIGGITTIGNARDNYFSLFAGAKVQVNLGDAWSVSATARGNAAFKSLDAGVTFHL